MAGLGVPAVIVQSQRQLPAAHTALAVYAVHHRQHAELDVAEERLTDAALDDGRGQLDLALRDAGVRVATVLVTGAGQGTALLGPASDGGCGSTSPGRP